MSWYEDYGFSGSQGPVEAEKTPAQRLLTLGLKKGPSLGVLGRDVEAESILEHVVEMGGSVPTAVATAKFGGPLVAGGLRAATGITATKIAAEAVAAGTLGAGAGAVTAAQAGEDPLMGAIKGGALYGGGEYVGTKGLQFLGRLRKGATDVATEAATPELRALTTGRGLARVEPERIYAHRIPTEPPPSRPLASLNAAIKKQTETPSAEQVDIVTTQVSDTPTIVAMERRGGSFNMAPETPPFQIATIGPKIDAAEHGVRGTRITLDHFVDSPTTLWAPSRLPLDPQGVKLRGELEERFSVELMKTAESMTERQFQTYVAKNPLAREVIEKAGSNPVQMFRAAQIVKGISAEATTFSPMGKTPFFTETFDETLGKKVLVPLNDEAGAAVDAMKLAPSPRHLELQLGAEQLTYMKTPKGAQFLRDIDVVAKNEPMLTSNILKKTDDEIDRIVQQGDAINITQPSIIQKTPNAGRVSELKKSLPMSEKEIDDVYAAIERDVDTQLGALSKGPAGLTAKEKALMDALRKGCS